MNASPEFYRNRGAEEVAALFTHSDRGIGMTDLPGEAP